MEIINEATASPKPTLREMLATGHQITLHATQEIKRFSTGMFDVINRNIKTYLPPIVDSTAQGVARLFEDKSGNNIVGDMATGVGGYFGEMAYNTLPPIMKDAITGWKKLMDKGEDTSLINSSPDDTQESKDQSTVSSTQVHNTSVQTDDTTQIGIYVVIGIIALVGIVFVGKKVKKN